MLETHELGDILHRRCIEVFARGKEGKVAILAVGAEVPLFHFIFRRIWLDASRQSSRVTDALFELAEVMIGGIKRMLRVYRFVICLSDIARFLAVQETDNELIHSLIPVRIGTITFIAKIIIERPFSRGLEGPIDVEHFGELGIALFLCPFMLLVGL